MEALNQAIKTLSGWIWGVPMIVLLFGTHIFLTIRLHFIQRHTFKAIRLSLKQDVGSRGEISQFGALATALAATIGTGNIVGVSTAVALGGPGAVLWCWLTGVFGIATKYGEALLSVKYRTCNERGEIVGGPMYTIQRGLHCKWLAVVFAVFTVLATFGAGSTVQSHAISNAVGITFGVPGVVTGVVITVITAIVVLGGVQSISHVCEKLVPFMSLFYITGCVAILALNWRFILPALGLIVESAFTTRAAAGGFVGSTLMIACRYGMARGLFSNESGLGTAPIAAASAQTRNPVRQALVSMTGTFWDTVVVCAMTGIVIVSTGMRMPELFRGLGDDALTQAAFAQLPGGNYILTVALSIFAFTTILGWSYYGERSMEYLFGSKGASVYRIVFLVMVFLGAVVNLDLVWNFSDLMNGLMAFPNLISVLLLSGVIVRETRHYLWENHLDEVGGTGDDD